MRIIPQVMGIFRPEMVAVVVVGFAMSKVALLESAEATLAIRICFLFVNIANVLAHIWFYRAADGPDSELPPVVLKSGRLLPVNDHDKAAALLQLRSAFASVRLPLPAPLRIPLPAPPHEQMSTCFPIVLRQPRSSAACCCGPPALTSGDLCSGGGHRGDAHRLQDQQAAPHPGAAAATRHSVCADQG